MRQIATLLGVVAAIALLSSCGGGGGGGANTVSPGSGSTPPPPPPPTTGVGLFSDVTDSSGIFFDVGFNVALANTEIPVILPSGAAVADYDGDGDLDLFIVRGDAGPNLLYRNLGNLVFEDVAADAGVAFTKSATENWRHSSPVFVDLDGDDDDDLLLFGLDLDPAVVYANNGDGTFTDVTTGSGLDTMVARYTMSPTFGDYDLDGDLDLMVGHWGTPRDYVNGPGDTEHLWRNDSDASGIRFTSVSEQCGIAPSIITNADPLITQRSFDHTFTPTFVNINDDAYPDILMVGDFNFSQVFVNNQDGTFTNATDFDVIIDGNGMGSAVGDYDGDGDLDWFVSSILADGDDQMPTHLSRIGNRLYRNDDGAFSDVTDEAGVADGGWGWGSCFIDFENDGDLDIYHTNGWLDFDEYGGFTSDRSKAFVSAGDGTFSEQAADLGLNDEEQGRGVVCADFDQDGDVDILQLHMGTTNAATLFANGSSNNFLGVKLRGVGRNTRAVGARVSIANGSDTQLREVSLGSNFASHNPTWQLFGLDAFSQVDTLTVVWPDGEVTTMSNVAVNQYLVVDHPNR